MAIAVHELATNAAKYGALSTDGLVEVIWYEQLVETVPSFVFRWSETGGPQVSEPPAEKKGFGSRLIEHMLPSDFGGTVRTLYAPGGVVCELVAPMSVLAIKPV